MEILVRAASRAQQGGFRRRLAQYLQQHAHFAPRERTLIETPSPVVLVNLA